MVGTTQPAKEKRNNLFPGLLVCTNLANAGQVCRHLLVPVLPRPTNKGKPRFPKTGSTQLSKAGSPRPEVSLAVNNQVYTAVHLLGTLSCPPTSKTRLPKICVCMYVCMYVCMFIQGYPRHSSGTWGVPVVKKLVKKKKKERKITLKDIFYILIENIQLTGTF